MTVAGRKGFILVTVLIVTAVGLLFGAGALLLFRFQCQQRIERQHELEKVYAVRSALNWARTYDDHVQMDGISLGYYTGSSRLLSLFVKPVEPVFPDAGFSASTGGSTVKHLVMEQGYFTVNPSYPNQYNPGFDYEYGMMSNLVEIAETTVRPNLEMVGKIDESHLSSQEKGNEGEKPKYGLDFPNATDTDIKWWVNVGMPGTGGWLHTEYGRRYYFKLGALVGSGDTGATSDIFHLCIIRDTYHPEYSGRYPGCQHGWPLSSKEGTPERALVLRIEKNRNYNPSATSPVAVYMELYEYVYGKMPELLARHESPNTTYEMGLQIAGKKVALFWFAGSDLRYPVNIKAGDREMSDKTYLWFRGDDIDESGRIRSSPDLRAVFEIIAASSVRTGTSGSSTGGPTVSEENFVESFKVAPAYQYDIFLKCPNVDYPQPFGVRATVAQLMYTADSSGSLPVLTYDTHGTENKGFRKDEREAERKRNGR